MMAENYPFLDLICRVLPLSCHGVLDDIDIVGQYDPVRVEK